MSADILHEGHINIINTASKYGEVIAGLLTDKAISWNKNQKNLFDNYAENILRKLVDLDYQVILRTHPESVKIL